MSRRTMASAMASSGMRKRASAMEPFCCRFALTKEAAAPALPLADASFVSASEAAAPAPPWPNSLSSCCASSGESRAIHVWPGNSQASRSNH